MDRLGKVLTTQQNLKDTKESEDNPKKCDVCGEDLTVWVELFGVGSWKRVICSCRKKEIAETKARLEREEESRKIDEILRFSMLDASFRSQTFENFEVTPDNSELHTIITNYLDHFRENGRKSKGLLLYGVPGIGKTFGVACIANALIDEGWTVLPMRMDNIIQRVYESYGNYKDYSESDILRQINSATLLIIDDIGTEHSGKSEKEKQLIYSIIDNRYRIGLPTICTTNLDLAQLKDKLTGYDGVSRTYDRIIEMCTPVKINGVSRRITKARNESKEFIGFLKNGR